VPQIGDILREARIRKGLSIKDVSDVTKIRTRYLEALEQDDYELMPGTTFVKAYLRNYATFLRLDADALVEEYRYGREPRTEELGVYRNNNTAEQQRPPASLSVRRMRKGHRDRRGYAIVGVLAVVVIVLLAVLYTGRGQPAATLDPESVGGSLTTTTSTSLGGVTGSDGGTTVTTGEGGESTTTTAGVVATGQNVTLVLTVTEGGCFLVVREDSEGGAERYTGTLSAGEEQTFSGSKRYWLHVGAPNVLVLTVNGVERTIDGPAGYYVVTETQIAPAP
jgi:transcriptional regulator with XRE-family HTH domain